MAEEKLKFTQKINDKWGKVILGALVVGVVFLLLYLFTNWSQINNIPFPFQPASKTTTEPVPFKGQVELTAKGFTPKTVLINKGSTVAFVNKDKKNHSIYPDPHPLHQNPDLKITESLVKPETSLMVTFNKPGKYVFHTEDDPLKTKATIVVQ